jgi:stage V sporulation protein B
MGNNEHLMAKGTLHLMVAQAVFLVGGYIIHFGLARIVTPSDYGRFGVTLAILQILQIFLVKGIPEAVTKYISEGKDTKKTNSISFKIQLSLSFSIFVIIIVLSPFIADILNDDKLMWYIIIISLVIPIRAIYSIYTGYLIGLREFKKVGIIYNINYISRVLFVFLFILIGFGILGALGGIICGSMLSLFFSYYLTRKKEDIIGKNISSKEIIRYATPMIIFSATYLILMNLDLLFIKSFLNNPINAGYYTAARMISSIIFIVFFGLSISLLPSISKSVSKKDIIQIRSYIHLSLRYMLMIIVPICIIIGIYANGFITLFYPDEYGLASSSLSLLIIGTALITIFVIFGTIINGAGKPKISMCIGGISVIIFIILNYILVPRYGMEGGALSTCIIGLITMIISGILVYKYFKALVEIKSFFKIFIGGLIIGGIGFFIDTDGLSLILWTFVLLAIYIFILYLLKEIKKEDIKLAKAILMKK